MITVRLYGLLRLDSGIRELELEAETIRELFTKLELHGLSGEQLSGCYILRNGERVTRNAKLTPNDTVQFFPPVAGG